MKGPKDGGRGDTFQELKAVRYGWNEGYVLQQRERRLHREAAGSQRAVCATLRDLTLKKWPRIRFRVGPLGGISQNKKIHSTANSGLRIKI